MKLLDIIAKTYREQNLNKNIVNSDDASKLGFEFENSSIGNRIDLNEKNDVVIESRPVADIGNEWLQNNKFLNLNPPESFQDVDINSNNLAVNKLDEIDEIGENQFNRLKPLNKFGRDIEYEFIYPELALAYQNQIDNYDNYMQLIKANCERAGNTIIDKLLNPSDFEDTPMAEIASDALSNQFNINIQENLRRTTIGRVNLDPYSLLDGDSLFIADFEITKQGNTALRTLDYLAELQNYNIPFSPIPEDAIGLYDDGLLTDEARIELLLEYTGKGQQLNLRKLDNNLYNPWIKGREFEIAPKDYYNSFTDISEFNYEFLDGSALTYKDNYNQKIIEKSYGNPLLFSSEQDFSFQYDRDLEFVNWNKYSENLFKPKSLLHKTKELVNNSLGFTDMSDTSFTFSNNGQIHNISRGDATTAGGNFIADDGTFIKEGDYFRVFTQNRKYNRLSRTLRHRGLDNGDKRSVLKDNGLVNMAPTVRNRNTNDISLIKKYMFSIENLAWADNLADLPECERGNGDPLSGIMGRIMWFPPYNLKFNENVDVNWTPSSFIGRGENIYTYNNTTRSATVSFSLIVDHPDIVNRIRGQRTEIWERFFKGDKSAEEEVFSLSKNKLSPQELAKLKSLAQSTVPVVKSVDTPVTTPQQKQIDDIEDAESKFEEVIETNKLFSVYFPNESVSVPTLNGVEINNDGYEDGDGNGLGQTYVNSVQKFSTEYRDSNDFGLNSQFYTQAGDIIIDNVLVNLNDTTKIVFKFFGNASKAITSSISNYTLSKQRASNVEAFFKSLLTKKNFSEIVPDDVEVSYEIEALSDTQDSVGNEDDSIGDTYGAKQARRVDVIVEYVKSEEVDDDNLVAPVAQTFNDVENNVEFEVDYNQDNLNNTTPDNVDQELFDKLFYTECDYFDYLEINQPALYKTISENIKYFHPAFHSTTPQGFNSRLNFLHQCTRQGDSIGKDGITNIRNLAFGRPPVCIMRIGDFFYTKIIIESLSIDYQDTPKWDLNPEGIGVQPMIANISMNIKILGGSTMDGPINKLQNALSFNFYANTEMYDARADSIVFDKNNVDDDGQIQGQILDGIKLSKLKNGAKTQKVVTQSRIVTTSNLNNQTIDTSKLPTQTDNKSILDLKKQLNLTISNLDK